MGQNDSWRRFAQDVQAEAWRHEYIENFHYADGIRLAVNFTADYDAMLFRRLLNEPAMQKAKGEFGGRVGIWRLIELFDSHGVKATFFTPGRICELYPQSLYAAVAGGHELADHMWEHQCPEDEALQRDHIGKTADALEKIAGTRPVGTRSFYEHHLLAEAGHLYNSSAAASHRPYYVYDKRDGSCLLQLPFHYALDDAQFFNFNWLSSPPLAQRLADPQRVMEIWWDAFMHQYREGGYLNICLHPFISGRALRIDMLDMLITRMKRLPGVWFPTCRDVAQYCYRAFPPRRIVGAATPSQRGL